MGLLPSAIEQLVNQISYTKTILAEVAALNTAESGQLKRWSETLEIKTVGSIIKEMADLCNTLEKATKNLVVFTEDRDVVFSSVVYLVEKLEDNLVMMRKVL